MTKLFCCSWTIHLSKKYYTTVRLVCKFSVNFCPSPLCYVVWLLTSVIGSWFIIIAGLVNCSSKWSLEFICCKLTNYNWMRGCHLITVNIVDSVYMSCLPAEQLIGKTAFSVLVKEGWNRTFETDVMYAKKTDLSLLPVAQRELMKWK